MEKMLRLLPTVEGGPLNPKTGVTSFPPTYFQQETNTLHVTRSLVILRTKALMVHRSAAMT
jgi:hypothetical protein